MTVAGSPQQRGSASARALSPATGLVAAGTVAIAAASWVVSVGRMDGMDMGPATELGSLASFLGFWTPMMAAMMLPGAAPALVRLAANGRGVAAPAFAGSYLALWILVGVALYVVYQPHGSTLAGALTIAAGIYELTPFKRSCRRRCRETARSGLEFGLRCLGSSAGLMVMLVAVGVMSTTAMAVIAAVLLAQKLLPPRAAIDIPVAVAIVALGTLIIVAPDSVPGFVAAM